MQTYKQTFRETKIKQTGIKLREKEMYLPLKGSEMIFECKLNCKTNKTIRVIQKLLSLVLRGLLEGNVSKMYTLVDS